MLCVFCLVLEVGGIPVHAQAPHPIGGYAIGPANGDTTAITDEDIARVNLQLLASGDKDAAWELGLQYMQGLGVPQDPAKAEQMFQIGATDTDEKGMVGMFYARGYLPANLAAVERWYSAAGRPQDYFDLAEAFKAAAEADKSVESKYHPKATAIYLKLLKDPGQPQARRAQLELGNFVIDGIYSEGSDEEGRARNMTWARMIAQELLGQKEYQSAVEYDIGNDDLPADKAMWLRNCERAAAYNIDNAQHFYVQALNAGNARDFTGYDAVAWTRLNSQKVFADKSLLAAMTSSMTPQQRAEAESSYHGLLKTHALNGAYYVQDDPLRNPSPAALAAMDQDDPDVQLREAFSMEHAAAQDSVLYQRVIATYRTVRDHSDYDFRFVLGRYALYGKNGVPQNRAVAEYWLNEAARSGSLRAQQLLDEIRSHPPERR